MPVEITLPLGTLFGFLLVLARVLGAMTFIPLPGFSAAPAAARVVLSLACTFCLASRWPVLGAASLTAGRLAASAVAEAAVGILIGVAVAVVIEAFVFAMQVLGLPAGYGYASTVDPNTEADSGILLVLAQLVAGLLFLTLGLDREVLRLLARSLESVPVGTYPFGPGTAKALIAVTSTLFIVGSRLAMPIVALLALVDVALALLGRLNAQLQLLSLAFPVKMMVALIMLAWLAALQPRIMVEHAAHALSATRRALGL